MVKASKTYSTSNFGTKLAIGDARNCVDRRFTNFLAFGLVC